MKRTICFVTMGVLLLFPTVAMAEEPVTLESIVVREKKLVKPTKQTNDTVYTGSEIIREGIDAQGAKAAVSVYEAVNILPGVSVESIDPFGLAAEQKNIRIRGVRGFLGAMTVAGIPNYGGNPMGPREYLYDMENFESIAVYKGAVPADLGTGVGARGGAIELRPLWPEETWGVKFGQGIGENAYSRTFLRLDSGALPVVSTRLSVSGSYTDAEKWKGPGDLGPRKNANIMLSQPINDRDTIQLWFNLNDLDQNLYKPLTYDEVKDLGDNYDNDYNGSLTGIASQDINYFDYNRGNYRNRDFLSVIPISFTDAFKLTVKPYYSKEDTDILGGTTVSGNYVVQRRMRDIERYGLISQLDYRFDWLTASLGYWFEDSDMVISQKYYNVATHAFAGYGMVMENEDDGIVHSPYLKLAGSTGPLDWQAGLKYFHYTDPASQGYTASAPDYQLVKASDLYRQEKTYDELLPTVGVNCHIGDDIELFASYGRNQIRPYAYVPLVNVYNKNRAAFQAAGVTLDDMFSGYDMETSDNIELGARFRLSWMEIMPTFFYTKHKNLLTTVHDPRIGTTGVNYYQNVGEATGYGVELETNFFLGDHVTFFFNPTYTSLTYDEDLTYAGATMDTEDNQVVDTPEWMFKTGLILRWRNFEVVPMLSYLDDRYGDAENTEEVDNYVVANLKVGYTLKDFAFCKSLKVSLELINLFDEEYVSLINAMDDSRSGSTSYYAGAPFTSLLSVSLEI
ncbi:TonB-dependent receptor [Desulfosarcina ovata]|uniref:TonB-dependent receptor n=2 Tax=Desulfosarcina ovata TaxID=83564 RepID=A0A5K8AA91_9BACT|nr:TonB-dependent receptor [Desulfosarcina ovata]BBO82285.1 TonB-dependent receptor [Desulfosarcina ovata subsp. sediminis]BBO89497.1 TonB-dependent receptor [Desulfosarcina ovata subsp. ovata]